MVKNYGSWIGAGVVLLVYLASVTIRTYPVIAPDEEGYIFQAQFIAGQIAGNMGAAPYYHFGHSIFLAPVLWLISDPLLAYKGMVAVNALLMALLVPCLTKIGRFFGYKSTWVIVAAAIVALWPSYFSVAHYAWSESSFRFVVAFSVVLLIFLIERRNVYVAAAFGVASAFVYAIHPKGLMVPPIAAAVLVGLWFSGAVRTRCLAVSLSGLILGYVAILWISGTLQEAIWEGESLRQSQRLLSRLSNSDIQTFLAVVAGQAWYQIVASVGLVTLGGLFLILHIKENIRRPSAWVALYMVLVVSGVAAASVAQMLAPQRVDHIAYGRYIDGASFLFLWIGFCTLLSRANTRIAMLSLGVSMAAALLLAGALYAWPRIHELTPAHPNNVAGIGWIFREGSTPRQFLLLNSAFAICVFVLLLASKSRYSQLMLTGIIVLGSATYVNRYMSTQSDGIQRGVNINLDAIRSLEQERIYWTEQSRHSLGLYHLQYASGKRFQMFTSEVDPKGVVISKEKPGADYHCVGALRGGLFLYRQGGITVPVSTPLPFTDATLICGNDTWQAAEKWGRWTSGQKAYLALAVPEGITQPVLQMEVFGLVGGATTEQRIGISVNGNPIDEWVLNNSREIREVSLLRETSEVIFTLPNASSPSNLNISADERILAMAVTRICLTERGRRCL